MLEVGTERSKITEFLKKHLILPATVISTPSNEMGRLASDVGAEYHPENLLDELYAKFTPQTITYKMFLMSYFNFPNPLLVLDGPFSPWDGNIGPNFARVFTKNLRKLESCGVKSVLCLDVVSDTRTINQVSRGDLGYVLDQLTSLPTKGYEIVQNGNVHLWVPMPSYFQHLQGADRYLL